MTSTIRLSADFHGKACEFKLTNNLPDDTRNHEIRPNVSNALSGVCRGRQRSTRTLHDQRRDVASDEDIRVPVRSDSAPLLAKLDNHMLKCQIDTSSQEGRRKDDYSNC